MSTFEPVTVTFNEKGPKVNFNNMLVEVDEIVGINNYDGLYKGQRVVLKISSKKLCEDDLNKYLSSLNERDGYVLVPGVIG